MAKLTPFQQGIRWAQGTLKTQAQERPRFGISPTRIWQLYQLGLKETESSPAGLQMLAGIITACNGLGELVEMHAGMAYYHDLNQHWKERVRLASLTVPNPLFRYLTSTDDGRPDRFNAGLRWAVEYTQNQQSRRTLTVTEALYLGSWALGLRFQNARMPEDLDWVNEEAEGIKIAFWCLCKLIECESTGSVKFDLDLIAQWQASLEDWRLPV